MPTPVAFSVPNRKVGGVKKEKDKKKEKKMEEKKKSISLPMLPQGHVGKKNKKNINQK